MYTICYDNNSKQYVVLNRDIADSTLRYLNVTELAEADTEADAYDKLLDFGRKNQRGDHCIALYNLRKKQAKEKYDRYLWDDEKNFYYLAQENFAPLISMGYEEAFGTKLIASNYMRRLMWYLIDPLNHTEDELAAVEGMTGSLVMLMTADKKLEVGMIMFNFTEMLKCLSDLSTVEKSRIQMIRDLCNPNKII